MIGLKLGLGLSRGSARGGGRAIPTEWLSAKDPADTVLGVVGVAAMKDIRTGSVVATQTEGLRQPGYVSGSHWAFTDDAMAMSAAPTVETVVMSVSATGSATGSSNGFYGGLSVSTSVRAYFGLNTSNKFGVGLGDNHWGVDGFYSNVEVPSGFYTLTVELDGVTKRCRMYLNGTLIIDAVATGTKYSGVPFLGSINIDTTAELYGEKNIREFLRFPSILSDSDRNYYQNLISAKWT